MRVKLKSSKSYPNDLLNQQQQPSQHQENGKNHVANVEEGDNSSSGVSSDQELTVTHVSTVTVKNEQKNQKETIVINNGTVVTTNTQTMQKATDGGILKKPIALPPLSNVTKQITTAININAKTAIGPRDDDFDDQMDSPSPPSKGFQRHNSLTRKQAATIAMNRAIQTRSAVSLVQLPPPLEDDSDSEQHQQPPKSFIDQKQQHYGRTVTTINTTCKTLHSQNQHLPGPQRARTAGSSVVVVVPPPMAYDNNKTNGDTSPSQETILLAPPPQFCDCTNANISKIMNNNNAAGLIAENNATGGNNIMGANRSVRIVGAVPKISRLHSQ